MILVVLQHAQLHLRNKSQHDRFDQAHSEECLEKELILFLQLELEQSMLHPFGHSLYRLESSQPHKLKVES